MGAFESQQTFFQSVTDLEFVVREIERHFRSQGFEVASAQRMSGAWDISLTRSNVFKTVCGLRSALKIELVPLEGSLFAKADIGIFGQQVIPSVVSYFFFWPVLVTQIWGMIQQSKLDEEALRVVGECLKKQACVKDNEMETADAQARSVEASAYCTGCHRHLPADSVFCPKCGKRVE